MNGALRSRLLAVAGASALAIAATLGDWYEGTGPTVKQPSGAVLYKPYPDSGGIWTVCRGVTGAKDVDPSRLYTEAECKALETKHLKIAEAAARRHIAGYDQLNKWQQAALIDWFYNLGATPATTQSTLVAKFARGDIDDGCRELSRWVKSRVRGELVTLNGLVDRRGAEAELCLDWGAR
ncbi:lysozyme [Variovorax sp. PAMC26660]|uniref:lysozyme n=1 Tax=Variovorax sp. PAMC26660 TaxID=2762322 RepID=UPI00164D443E|nr:lysozyme [Variovorax sp. PAMC26660]QNK68446.1 lysozyme [Variovorax sp. PAMC26660]